MHRSVHPHLRGAYLWGGHNPHPLAVHPHLRGAYGARAAGRLPQMLVHPHLRGAYPRMSRTRARNSGSSPPTWGIPYNRQAVTVNNRFIPTYVGHTPPAATWQLTWTVHPHLRGAYTERQARLHAANGSSPPTWGIRARKFVDQTIDRFIPTYVGHTAECQLDARRGAVHPHLRGAYRLTVCTHFVQHRFIPTYVGHTENSKIKKSRETRFIPTYVGHTPGWNSPGRRYPVHPHLRGAYLQNHVIYHKSSGSSPPTWGIPVKIVPNFYRPRFIPTYVGHTPPRPVLALLGAVHPHLRGAYEVPDMQGRESIGSSPPTWGILSRMNPDQWKLRFIPTYVGHTICELTEERTEPVHPHLRGAYMSFVLGFAIPIGSSPPTWGIRWWW